LAYDIVAMDETKDEIVNSTSIIIQYAIKKMEPPVDEGKT